ncbi:hypothetical protein [Methylomonas albis]|uniref:Anti-sigma-28 factor FlgM C-terminal domain-containing protein n=1 Tax=Methylomonas albis TaxID=1854563 RepID=A0ABR9D4A0_9GAMM|nr:hypothetical protein [Methylomonas albis]MBD9357606.1 hypothetical protein [Methylomonas albis]CAD6880908.1 hypothetical protein [Methylomonas albis]
MEINTTYPNQNTLASQSVSRDQKSGGIEESAERRKANNPQSQVERTEQGLSDTVNLSQESLKLAQAANGQNNDNQARINSPQQAQQVVGKLISDIQSNPGQAQFAIANRSHASLGVLLN